MVTLDCVRRGKKTLSPIKSKQTGETLALSCKWTVQEANLFFFALSYLIHSSPRLRCERRLCSNPPLLIPPSLHPALLHPTHLPPSPWYYLSSAAFCFPHQNTCNHSEIKNKIKASMRSRKPAYVVFCLCLNKLCVRRWMPISHKLSQMFAFPSWKWKKEGAFFRLPANICQTLQD